MNPLPLDAADVAWLTNLARALIGEASAADDLVQETMAAAVVSPSAARALSSPTDKRRWLASVVRRQAARWFRGQARRTQREARVAQPESLPDTAALIERAEVLEKVSAAARSLPEPFRRTILLRFLEERTPDEIASLEDKPADTIRWRVRRGLELLREELCETHELDWSSWCVLLLPLAQRSQTAGLATAGVSTGSIGTVASWTLMKTILISAAVCSSGLWWLWSANTERTSTDVALREEASVVERGPRAGVDDIRTNAPDIAQSQRTAATTATPPTAERSENPPVPGRLFGRVVDLDGRAIEGAIVYSEAGTEESLRTNSARDGSFELRVTDSASGELELGVAANGYLRANVVDALRRQPEEGWTIQMERGRSFTARVVDPEGLPVPGLELLAHTPNGRIDHVSPSQSRRRAERAELGGSRSAYRQSLARTDGSGTVVFQGLPDEELFVRALAADWILVDADIPSTGAGIAVWTALPCAGVQLEVVDLRTGRPLNASATFKIDAAFDDGETVDWGQWVGRGTGFVSFALTPGNLPDLDGRVMTRGVFRGTVSSEGVETTWRAEPLENRDGIRGLAKVRVELDVGTEEQRGNDAVPPRSATLELVVNQDDASPLAQLLLVEWEQRRPDGVRFVDDDRVKPEEPGRYRVEVFPGELSLRIEPNGASGSLGAWTGTVRAREDGIEKVYVTLPSGTSAVIQRPEGWSGEWFVEASYREPGTEEWLGRWVYSTAGESLQLNALRPAEWCFRRRPDPSYSADPLETTLTLEIGREGLVP